MKLDFTKLRGSIDGLPAFLLVAERRSFKAAALELGVSPSAVSQTIRTLEERLGVALLQRTTRSVGLTEAGERFLHWARPALEGLGQALDAVSSLAEKPSGLLRLNASRGFIGAVINDVLPSFLAANPERPGRDLGRRRLHRHRGGGVRRRLPARANRSKPT